MAQFYRPAPPQVPGSVIFATYVIATFTSAASADVDDRAISQAKPTGQILPGPGQNLKARALTDDSGLRVGCHRTSWSSTGPDASSQRFRASNVLVDCTSRTMQTQADRSSGACHGHACLAAAYSSYVERRAGTARLVRVRHHRSVSKNLNQTSLSKETLPTRWVLWVCSRR